MDSPNHGRSPKKYGGLSYGQIKSAAVVTLLGSVGAWHFAPLGSSKWAMVVSLGIGAFVAQIVASALGVED